MIPSLSLPSTSSNGERCPPFDILVVGRPSCDLVFTGLPSWPLIGRETYAQDLLVTGGGSLNVVVAMARLGLRVGMVGTVGNDRWSRIGLEAMAEEGVSAALIQVLDQPLPSVSVCMALGGDRGFLTYDGPGGELAAVCVAHARAVTRREWATYLQCCLNPDLPDYADAARERGMTVVVDCGWDEPWLTSRDIRALMPLAGLVFANEPEARAITGETDTCAALRRLGELVPFVVVKRGPEGASALVAGREYHAPTEPVEVVDATGAGDCFNAGFLYGLCRGRPVGECLRLGNICGGMGVQVPGGYTGAPTEAALITRAAQHGIALAPMGELVP